MNPNSFGAAMVAIATDFVFIFLYAFGVMVTWSMVKESLRFLPELSYISSLGLVLFVLMFISVASFFSKRDYNKQVVRDTEAKKEL